MKYLATILLFLASGFALPTTHAQPLPQKPAAAPEAKQAQVPDFKDDIDTSVKWLRFQQDRKDGSYGGQVETTALVLRAMSECPRHYGRNDGPFVLKAIDFLVSKQDADGSIHDAGASPADALRQTRLAAGALAENAHHSTEATLNKALAFIGKDPQASSETGPWQDVKLPESKADVGALAVKLLAQRAPDASWNGELRKTAENVVTLSHALHVLSPGDDEEEGGAKTPVKPLPKMEAVDHDKAVAALAKGALWLSSAGNKGLYGAPGKPNPGFTAMAIGGLLSAPEPRAPQVQEAIDNALTWLVSLQKPDGSIQDGELANYTTSAAVLALARSGRPEYKPVIAKAQKFLIELQADEGEGFSPDHPYYGGNSYGDEQRPDMSNVQMALEALAASGVTKDDPAFKRALVFLQRCQNRSESNDTHVEADGKTVVSGNDGGGIYTPVSSKAGYVDLEGGKRVMVSYGSMTYALLKCYVLVGVPKDDPRMKACWEWLKKNYTVDVNPGFERNADPAAGYQGLYYYLHTMAKALDLYGEETVTDAQGKPHSWRKEMAGRLVAMQRKDGSWTNENSQRWYEGNPVLATSWALISLQIAAK